MGLADELRGKKLFHQAWEQTEHNKKFLAGYEYSKIKLPKILRDYATDGFYSVDCSDSYFAKGVIAWAKQEGLMAHLKEDDWYEGFPTYTVVIKW